jgi:hypothetical protein
MQALATAFCIIILIIVIAIISRHIRATSQCAKMSKLCSRIRPVDVTVIPVVHVEPEHVRYSPENIMQAEYIHDPRPLNLVDIRYGAASEADLDAAFIESQSHGTRKHTVTQPHMFDTF